MSLCLFEDCVHYLGEIGAVMLHLMSTRMPSQVDEARCSFHEEGKSDLRFAPVLSGDVQFLRMTMLVAVSERR